MKRLWNRKSDTEQFFTDHQLEGMTNFAMLERAGIIRKRLIGYSYGEKIVTERELQSMIRDAHGPTATPSHFYGLLGAPQRSYLGPIGYHVVPVTNPTSDEKRYHLWPTVD